MQTTMSKSRKIYASVLGLAVAAFAVDRWVIGQPEPAQAAGGDYLVARATGAAEPAPVAAGPRPQPATAGAAAARAASHRPLPAEPLAARLASAANVRESTVAEVRDAFRPSAAWVDRRPTTQPAEPPPVPPRDPVAEFRGRHKLNAVMTTAAGGVAIIDGKTLRPGARVDGFRLASVGLRSAVLTLEGTDRELEMTLDRPAGDARAAAN